MSLKYIGVLGVVVLIAVGIGYVYLFQAGSAENQQAIEVMGEPDVTIVRTDNGYEPREVTIKKGDIVLWVNESSEFHWPASDLHPTHGVYPEFDPRKPIAPGDEWKFQFNEVGEWKFHDHIRANQTGVVTVE